MPLSTLPFALNPSENLYSPSSLDQSLPYHVLLKLLSLYFSSPTQIIILVYLITFRFLSVRSFPFPTTGRPVQTRQFESPTLRMSVAPIACDCDER